MKKKYLTLLKLSAAACLICTACSDDSTIIGTNSCSENADCDNGQICRDRKCVVNDAPLPECADDTECEKWQTCTNGQCIDDENAPECTEDTDCGDRKFCRDGSCFDAKDKGASCSDRKHIMCLDGLECINAKCVEIIPKGGRCDENDADQKCADGYTCTKSICAKPMQYECLEDADCSKSPEKPYCIDNACVSRAAPGQECDEITTFCQNDNICIGICVSVSGLNEPCGTDDNAICDEDIGLKCFNDVCLPFVPDLPIGEDCNDIDRKCAGGLSCVSGKCSKIVKEAEECRPDQYLICDESASQKCIKNICTPVGSTCTTSAECTEKDSYCCLKESCGAVNRCVPYDDETTHDDMCLFKTKPGIFEARIQCRWQPPADQHPESSKVEMPPLVGPFGNSKGLKSVVAFTSYRHDPNYPNRFANEPDLQGSPGKDKIYTSCIRFINPETCETLETICTPQAMRWQNYPAAADLDGDGLMEYIAITHSGNLGIMAYKWNGEKHVPMWAAPSEAGGTNPMVYDVNGDGKPEIIAGTSVIDGLTGKIIHRGNNNGSATWSIGIFDNDPLGMASLLTGSGVYKWQADNSWKNVLQFSGGNYTAYADFGTPGQTAEDFDFRTLDGYPEFVLAGGNKVYLYAGAPDMRNPTQAQKIMDVSGFSVGGPVTIGDFNNDGLPEIGIASSGLFGVYDPKCTEYEEGKCADKNVLWERWSQDASSGQTGSSLFDFDGDGQTEAVYADECFTRVYDGKTGKVLFSAKRSSWTSFEAPVIADVDDDGSAEILMGSDYDDEGCYNDKGQKVQPSQGNGVDPIHEGIPCLDDDDCPTGKGCRQDIGLCTCTTDDDCNTQFMLDKDGKQILVEQYICTDPIHPDLGFKRNTTGTGRNMMKSFGAPPDGYAGDYKVCRATRKTGDIGISDLMIFRDRLDRWVSSRNIWNQHAYNIINIQDNGQVQTFSQWLAEWFRVRDEYVSGSTSQKRPVYNNFRMNEQGKYGAGTVPDITGRFIAGSICGKTDDGRYVISAKLCNRGTKPVATNLPASFYYYDSAAADNKGTPICTSYTKTPVGVGQCDQVGCEVEKSEFDKLIGQKVLVVTNEDEHGHSNTVECNYTNNRDTIEIDRCDSDIVIIN